MDVYLRWLPCEVQYMVLRCVGCQHADPYELARAVRMYVHRQTTVYPVSANLRYEYYRYALPRWCRSCGEYREEPSVKCELCGHTCYRLVGW